MSDPRSCKQGHVNKITLRSFVFIYRIISDQEQWEEEPTEGFEIKEQRDVVWISERSFILL